MLLTGPALDQRILHTAPSLEYNMQEVYRGQKLANDLVDITATVTNDTLLYLIKEKK